MCNQIQQQDTAVHMYYLKDFFNHSPARDILDVINGLNLYDKL